jgi:TatD DNase family protein
MRLFDTHAHIGLIHEDPIEQLIVVQEARQEQVEIIVSICNNTRDFTQVYENLKTATHVYHAIGMSPSEVANLGRDWESSVEEQAQLPRVVAIGEIGLDYFRKFGNKSTQIELFIRQLEIADHLKLPVIIHNREAGHDIMEILKERLPARGGILHCYSEDSAYAQQAIELNLYISFAGNVTYRNAKNLHDTVKRLPLERILVESESPFMVPSTYRGKRNKPAYLIDTVQFIAELRGEDVEMIANATFENAVKLFGITP